MQTTFNPAPRESQQFCTTHWTVVLNARHPGQEGREALARLCEAYWKPLYIFARRKGNSPSDAEDLVQGFFEQLLRRESLSSVEPAKGRFRTFLLTSLTNFMANEWTRQNRLKRGGGITISSIEAAEAENRYCVESVESESPEALFDRKWAETLFEIVTRNIQSEYLKAGEEQRYQHLKQFLMSDGRQDSYAEIGAKLGLSEGGVKTSVRRLRLRFREVLREELSATVESASDVDDEVRHLLACLAAR